MTITRGFMSQASTLSLSAALLCVAVPVAAQSQSGSTTATPSTDPAQAIVVTGSRIQANGFDAPTPVTVVSTDQLNAAAPTNLGDALNQLPVFLNSSTPESTGVGTTGNVGQSFLNLRSLGPQRTLILLDGRRVVPSTAAGTTDISILPEGIVKRVDVVTGGASAAYGSDAVAGVVNFVLDTGFEGLKGEASFGTAEAGDSETYKLQLSGGLSFADGRGHVLLNGNYFKNSGIDAWRDRDWYNSCARIDNPAAGGGNPNFLVECDVHSAGFTRGGLITGGPLKGTEFGPGGEPAAFQYGDLATSLSMVGGSGEDHGANFPTSPRLDRKTAFAYFGYDLTDDLTFFVDGLFGQASAHYASTAPWEGQGTGYEIQIDNAFLPQSIRDRMTDAGVTSFPMWRYNYDFGLLIADSKNTTYRGTAGIKAKLGEWNVDAYYTHGENDYHQTTLHNPIINRLYNAADAVVYNGDIICRSTIAQPNNGCVPINLFGYGSPSQESLDWATGTTDQRAKVKQDVAEVSVSGSPFDIWAGAVNVAFGAGYRKESSSQTVDPTSTSLRHFTGDYLGFPGSLEGQLGGWERTNPQPLSGSYNVKEAFGEIQVPLLRDSALGRRLDLNAAVRYTDYSTSGGVTTWKVGATYEPIDGLRLRVARSRDIRAPNLSELYTGATQGQGNLTDPAFAPGDPRRTALVIVRSFGNDTLHPEKADTWTLGAVLQPAFLPDFSISADFYDIKIEDAVGTLGGQTTINQCFEGATALCDLLHRDAGGELVSVDTPYLNISSRSTRGVDFEMQYRHGFDNGSSLNLRGLATYVAHLTTSNPGAATLETAGQTGSSSGVPHWIANAQASFRTASGFGIFVQERYIGPGALDFQLTPADLDPALNHVSQRFYTDLTLSKEFTVLNGSQAELFLTVNNLFDQDPPLAPQRWFVFGVSQGSTNPTLFDITGRRYTAGIRFTL